MLIISGKYKNVFLISVSSSATSDFLFLISQNLSLFVCSISTRFFFSSDDMIGELSRYHLFLFSALVSKQSFFLFLFLFRVFSESRVLDGKSSFFLSLEKYLSRDLFLD